MSFCRTKNPVPVDFSSFQKHLALRGKGKTSQLVFLMDDPGKLKGRPLLENGKRNKKIDVRFSETEYAEILAMEKEFGIARAKLIRMRVLKDSGTFIVNSKELISKFDQIAGEIGRCGNNINQLARYGNILQLKEILDPEVSIKFNELLVDYISIQASVEVALRKVIRLMGK